MLAAAVATASFRFANSAALGPALAALLIVYSVWDLLRDPANSLQSGMTRVLFAGLAAIGFWPLISSWSAQFRAAWIH